MLLFVPSRKKKDILNGYYRLKLFSNTLKSIILLQGTELMISFKKNRKIEITRGCCIKYLKKEKKFEPKNRVEIQICKKLNLVFEV